MTGHFSDMASIIWCVGRGGIQTSSVAKVQDYVEITINTHFNIHTHISKFIPPLPIQDVINMIYKYYEETLFTLKDIFTVHQIITDCIYLPEDLAP